MTVQSLPAPPSTGGPPLVYSVVEAANALRLGRTHVYDLLRQGKLRSVKSGARRVIRHEYLVEYLDSLEGVES